jgi:signal peptidase II
MPPVSDRRRVLGLIAIVALLVITDQLSKAVARGTMTPGGRLPVIDGVLQITFFQNYGFSWWVPALPLWTKWALRFLLLVLALVTLPAYLFYARTRRQSRWADVAAAGLMASSWGHLADDIFVPYATDFIQILGWPSGNLADVYARVGLVAMIVEMILWTRERKPRWRGIRHLMAAAVKVRRELYEFIRDEIRLWRQGKG